MLRLYEFYQDSASYYLVTEYCSGGDLMKKLEEDIYYPETQVGPIMEQVFSAVEYCHRCKVVHR